MNNGTHALSYMQYVLGDPDPEWVIANVQRRSDRYERGWPGEELSGGLVSFAGDVRVSFEGDIPPDPKYDWDLQTVTGTDGVLMWPSAFLAPDFAVRIVRRGGGVEETPAPRQTLDDVFRRELDGLARWARGEISENRNDARLAIKTQEILMAMFESARTHTLVRTPLRTMASPLLEAIKTGRISVEYPGRYDTRYAGTNPCGLGRDQQPAFARIGTSVARLLIPKRVERVRARHGDANGPQPVGHANSSRVLGQHVIEVLVCLRRFIGAAAP